jgi:hypothetical protein
LLVLIAELFITYVGNDCLLVISDFATEKIRKIPVEAAFSTNRNVQFRSVKVLFSVLQNTLLDKWTVCIGTMQTHLADVH